MPTNKAVVDVVEQWSGQRHNFPALAPSPLCVQDPATSRGSLHGQVWGLSTEGLIGAFHFLKSNLFNRPVKPPDEPGGPSSPVRGAKWAEDWRR